MQATKKNINGWAIKRVDEIAVRITTRAGTNSTPYIEIGDIDTERKQYNVKDKPSPSICISAKSKDIVVSKVRPTRGAIAQLREDAFVSPAFSVLRAAPEDSDFLFYALSRGDFFNYLGTLETGTTYPSCDDGDIESYQINFPDDENERRKVSEIVSRIDAAIEKTNALIKKYERVRTGMMQDLFRYGIDEKGRVRSEKTHKFKNSPLGRVPEEWEIGGFEFVKHRTRPFIKTGPFGSSLKGEHWVEEGVPVITIGALGEGEFISSELFFITEDKAKSLDAYRVQSGDLVFSRVADVGRSVVVSSAENDWIMSSNLMRIALDSSKVLPYFAHLNLVHNPKTRGQIRALVNAGGREVANTALLNSLIFTWPNFDEQRRFYEAISALEYKSKMEMEAMRKMTALKKGLMRDLLTGAVRTIET